MKRKRNSHPSTAHKRPKQQATLPAPSLLRGIDHPVLSQYYVRVLSLRQFLLSHLDRVSKRRARIVRVFGKDEKDGCNVDEAGKAVTNLLDSVVVGIRDERTATATDDEERRREFETFSQQLASTLKTTASTAGSTRYAEMNELVDFALYILFHKVYKDHQPWPGPPHILCRGMSKSSSTWQNDSFNARCAVPGLTVSFPNEHVEALRGRPWCDVLSLLGNRGDRIMVDMMLWCGVFMPLDGPSGRYYQMSGPALSELKTISESPPITGAVSKDDAQPAADDDHNIIHRPSQIRFVRHRMLYARAALNEKGGVKFGLRHIHVLNRYPYLSNPEQTIHILKHLFPRQFGLHNVFTRMADRRETVQPFKDYTLRESEIAQTNMLKSVRRKLSDKPPALPKRLRGAAFELTRKLRKLHHRCSYTQLLSHYCPLPEGAHLLPSSKVSTQPDSAQRDTPSFTSLATSSDQVSAFCRSAVQRLFPSQFFGKGEAGKSNWRSLLENIDKFVTARRYESITLESVLQGIKVSDIAWLCPPSSKTGQCMAMTDSLKRRELLAELVYYIFDSFLIPLIRTNFHVTETSMHAKRLFYFRHDVWRRLTEPALSSLKTSMLEEVGGELAFKTLKCHTLGFSQIRLVPKEKGMRPITNLKRRMQVVQNGRMTMGKSINKMLTHASTVLNSEKDRKFDRFGASLFSVGAVNPQLRQFRSRLASKGLANSKLYFAKIDVRSSFDNLPQGKVIELARLLITANDYTISSLARLKPMAGHLTAGQPKMSRKFISRAYPGSTDVTFPELVGEAKSASKPNLILIDNVVPQIVSRKHVLSVLEKHISSNVIKIGKKYYRQKRGIAQGSVVSSLLCSLVYGDLEQTHLKFLNPETSLLLRLIDDFLLITTDRTHAERFLRIFHAGVPTHGVSIQPDKSLVNFPMTIPNPTNVVQRSLFPRLSTSLFPYCGLSIDTRTLAISKDMPRASRVNPTDGLTVSFTAPGRSFQQKVLHALNLALTPMLVDVGHNGIRTVMTNLRHALRDVVGKMVAYARSLRRSGSRLKEEVLRIAVKRLVDGLERRTKKSMSLGKKACWGLIGDAVQQVTGRRGEWTGLVDWIDGNVNSGGGLA